MSHTQKRSRMDHPKFQGVVTPFDVRVSQAMREIADGQPQRNIIERHGSVVMAEAMDKLPLSTLVRL